MSPTCSPLRGPATRVLQVSHQILASGSSTSSRQMNLQQRRLFPCSLTTTTTSSATSRRFSSASSSSTTEAEVLYAPYDPTSTSKTTSSTTSSKLHCVTLNRPKKLNSLSLTMIELLEEIYENRIPRQDAIVWLEGAGEKAFCAGGDVAALAEALRGSKCADRTLGGEFFHKEYKLDYKIAQKNQENVVTVSVWDKIVMGGGVGLGFHNPIRIVTEKTMFAMPETKIGLFPDVGMTWGLSRLANRSPVAIARFLGLTGARLNAADCVNFGVGTHFVKQQDLEAVKAHLGSFTGAVTPTAVQSHLEKLEDVVVKEVSKLDSVGVQPTISGADSELISRCFGHSAESVEAVMQRLEDEKTDFAEKYLKLLRDMSPLSLKVSFAAMERHRSDAETLRSALRTEYKMAMHCLRPQPEADFAEGVSALLLEKRAAKWSHEKVQDVPKALVDSYFATIEGVKELGPWGKELDI
ncbi:unnamed protein product [Amoebophrya sp. A120]|nr:unnamed protein product [Amoebophrya sp. A120]|eukprot:GSA120T00020789001.1